MQAKLLWVSQIAMGAVLAQPSLEHQVDRPIYYASGLLNAAERNYSTTKWEGLAIVYACQTFYHYLLGIHFIVLTDHHALKYLLNKPQQVAGRVWRWLLIFQEFNFEILLRPGKHHMMADHLSRIDSGEPASAAAAGINDDLPDNVLFKVDTALDW